MALLFLQGWRISEVLGLAWEDVDLDAGTAHVRRASVYVDGRGQQLGPPKTEGARGEHWLMPTVVALLGQAAGRAGRRSGRRRRRGRRSPTRASRSASCSPPRPAASCCARPSSKVVKQAAKTAGITADLGTHAGRRTVVTTLFVDGDEALEDIARFVGHARPATTAGYVKRLGHRPQSVAKRAAGILDAQALDVDGDGTPRVRNHPAILGATLGATAPNRPTRRRTRANDKPCSNDKPRTVENRPGQGGGRYGIRTHGDPEATTAFEAAPFVRSGNLPPANATKAPAPATNG